MRVGSFRQRDGRLRLAVALDQSLVLDVEAVIDALGAVAEGESLGAFERNFDWLTPKGLAALRSVVAASTALPRSHPAIMSASDLVYGPPVVKPGKFFAAGLNYLDHVKETAHLLDQADEKAPRPKYPPGFIRFASSITAHDHPIRRPRGVEDLDYEVELCVVIGTPAERVSVQDALKYVAGYTICNDLSTRGVQFEEMNRGIGIVLGKNFRSFAPLGPWLVTADEVPDPQTLDIRLTVNGEERQHSNTAAMIFSVAELVAHYSMIGLEPGDLITTGTPAGIAASRPNPERFYLKPGDVVEAVVETLGALRNPVVGTV